MKIFIDGCDGTGKSTVAKRLSALMNLEYVVGSSFEMTKLQANYLASSFIELIEDKDKAVYDRFHLSNLVYASLYDGYEKLTEQQVSMIEEKISKEKSLYFYLYAGEDTLVSRITKRGDDDVSTDMIPKILEKYEEVIKQSRLPIIKVNTSKGINGVVLELMEAITNRNLHV